MSEKLKREKDMAKAVANGDSLAAFQAGQEELDRLRPILLSFPSEKIRAFNLSIPATISYAIRTWQSYSRDQDLFTRTFTTEGFDPASVTDFPLRVAVLRYLDARVGQASGSHRVAPEVLAKAKPLYKKIAKAALYVYGDDETLGKVVKDIRQGSGHLDMAHDLDRYALLFTDNWSMAEGSCNVTKEDLVDAKTISTQILAAVTDDTDTDIEALKDLRDRAAEYVHRGAGDIRHGAKYIFREDPDKLDDYPSLYKPRGAARKTAAKKDAAEPAPEDPAQDAVV